ncbi:MAG: hypothetical protein RR340_11090 [Cloacibacillus sp.]
MQSVTYTEKSFREAWSEFISDRADEAATHLQFDVNGARYQEYQALLNESEALLACLGEIVPKEYYLTLDQFNSAKNSLTCHNADAAYAQGFKDAFAIIKNL